MRLDPRYVHPDILAKGDLTPAERTYLDTLQALADSLRSDAEMREAADVLGPALDARPRLSPERRAELDETAQAILKAAQGARDARSGMGVELCLDRLRLELDRTRALVDEALG